MIFSVSRPAAALGHTGHKDSISSNTRMSWQNVAVAFDILHDHSMARLLFLSASASITPKRTALPRRLLRELVQQEFQAFRMKGRPLVIGPAPAVG